MKIKGLVVAGLTMMMVHHLRAERPFATEDAQKGTAGAFQVELTWDRVRWGTDATEQVAMLAGAYALTDAFELALEIPYIAHDLGPAHRHEGIGDVTFAVKYLLAEGEDWWPSLSAKASVKSATGDDDAGLGSGVLDYTALLAATQDFGRIALHGMVGFTDIGIVGHRNIYFYGLAARWRITESLFFATEFHGNQQPDRRSHASPMAGLIGTAWQYSEFLAFDAGVRFGLTEVSPAWNTSLGITVGW